MPVLTSLLTPDYGWNPLLRGGTGGYIDLATGRAVKFSLVRDELERIIDDSKLSMRDVTQRLIDGGISLADWQLEMTTYIKDANIAASVSARGGWAQMTQADWGRAGQAIRKQYDYLGNYANQIYDGKQPLNGNALVRSQMYADASRGTFEQSRRKLEETQGGMTQERRLLAASDANNCETHGDLIGCKELAALNWKPINTLPAIGGAPCRTNCRCRFIYRKKGRGGKWIVSGE
jgi:hypothetical protein